MTRHLCPLITLCLLLMLYPASPAPAQENPPAPNKMGIHLLLDDGRNVWPPERWQEHMRYARNLTGPGGYVVQVIRSDRLDVDHWQHFMDLCARYDLIPVLRLATVFDDDNFWWQPPAPDTDGSYRTFARRYADFLLALEWPDPTTRYVIIGNEPNSGHEWGGTPDPAAYARLLLDMASVLHASEAGFRVGNAGFDLYAPHTNGVPFANGISLMDAESFMDAMVAAAPDVFSVLDFWVSHPYPEGALIRPPWEQTYRFDSMHHTTPPPHAAPPPGIHNRGINGYEWELWKLSTYGVEALPIMITETGWRKQESTDPAARDHLPGLPTAETVAVYFDLALHGNNGRYPDLPDSGWLPWLTDARIIAIAPFALNGHPREWGHTNWLQMSPDGEITGTYAMYNLLTD